MQVVMVVRSVAHSAALGYWQGSGGYEVTSLTDNLPVSVAVNCQGPLIQMDHCIVPISSTRWEAGMTTVTVQGFDSAGEPEIRSGEDGALEIMFNFMPPLNGASEPYPDAVFDTFEVVLVKALGVDVIREDRELFVIPNPQPDTLARAKAYLETFWTAAWPDLSKPHP
jgi:hypothetical protein